MNAILDGAERVYEVWIGETNLSIFIFSAAPLFALFHIITQKHHTKSPTFQNFSVDQLGKWWCRDPRWPKCGVAPRLGFIVLAYGFLAGHSNRIVSNLSPLDDVWPTNPLIRIR